MRFLSLIFLFLGLVILVYTSLPLISFSIWQKVNFSQDLPLLSPQDGSSQVLGVSVKNSSNNFPIFFSSLKRESKIDFDRFYLTIPSLKISSEEVFIDNNDLTLGLIHLPGSALPGERGNMFISGHSSLPEIFSKDRKAHFSNLQNLKKGDQILVTVGGSKFSYSVTGFRIVDPKDLSVILPPDSTGRYVTLMTCVPPGLNTKRLVVLGKLI